MKSFELFAIKTQRHVQTNRDGIGSEVECLLNKTYTNDNFRIIGQARSFFHLSVLESVYIKTQNPVLCKQKDFILSLGIFK